MALSGGVDSSVAAALLVERGHEVVGATMKLWGGPSDTGCCSVGDVEDARRAAAQLGIDHHVFNYGTEFDRHVVEPYLRDHASGRTPNPCVECNRHLKFDVLLERAELLGFDAVATGHHARLEAFGDGTRRLLRGADPRKDQSYVLHPLLGGPLERVVFPIGHLQKSEVRALAAGLGLRTASKPDSQDVCFVTRDEGRAAFLAGRMDLHPAVVTDSEGRRLGSVDAVELVTIGQRRGLNLGGGSRRRFVTSVDVDAGTVTVGEEEELLRDGLLLRRCRWADH
ncbi:MAG: tRNA 2-thiouridine(34) synthase MnmA [Microthrixaceae bacterium]